MKRRATEPCEQCALRCAIAFHANPTPLRPTTALAAIKDSSRVMVGPLPKEAVDMAIRFAALAGGWSGSRQETARQYLAEARGTRSYWLEVLEDALTLASSDPDDTVTLRDGRVLSRLAR